MLLIDARRLTGPSHLSRSPLVIVELALEPGETLAAAREAYAAELARMRVALGLSPDVTLQERAHRGGGVLGYEAPLDVMLACAEMSEWAGMSAVELMAERPALPVEPKRAEIAAMLASQESPRLLELAGEAARRGLPFLWDDETITVGMGARSVSVQAFPRAALPEVRDVAWDALGRIPVALVTGTNGKTTSTRLLARLASEAGLVVGAASTGGVTIGRETVLEGDWTGPAAARMILRRADVDLAVLETARGGILRRGLAVTECDVALLTNVSDDHLGLYGIDDMDAMAEVKGTVARAVSSKGTAVLSAHDPRLVALGASLDATIGCEVLFFASHEGREHGRDPSQEIIAHARANGRRCVFTHDGSIVLFEGGEDTTLMRIDEVPITFGGAAEYNVLNVLGAVGAALALGVPRDAMVRGLRGFDMQDNPGRGQLTVHRGVRVLLDFGHNTDGVRAVMQLVSRLRDDAPWSGGKLTVVTGCAGDRSDRELVDIAAAVWEARPARVLVRDLPDYLRGRAPGEVPAHFQRAFAELGLAGDAFAITESEVTALERAFVDAAPGDFIVVLVHVEEAETRAFLDSLAARP